MKTIAQLRTAGFTISDAEPAENCTLVVSPDAFWYYNPKFAKSITEVYISLRKATRSADGYGLTVAGSYADTDELPFRLIDAHKKEALGDAHSRYIRHQDHVTHYRDAMDKAEADFMHDLESGM